MRATFRRFDKRQLFLFFLKDFVNLIFLIFNASLSLVLGKILKRSSFYDIAYFSILASWPQLDPTIISENIFRSSSIGAIIFNCESLIWMLFLS